ncbi:hypothetical protein, partial [Vibrio sp.]|uniref:hypothetical protein n=1 Tax=Vibrio sp. TaxID=678 RepID=UPI003D114DFE
MRCNESADEIKRRNTKKMMLKKLLSDDDNIFIDAYPEKKKILSDWSNCTYYRKDSALARDYRNMIGTVIAILPPFDSEKKFCDYFGIKPCDFVENYIDTDHNEFIMPLMLEADKYKPRCVRHVYEPIFQDFKNLGDEKRYPVYA